MHLKHVQKVTEKQDITIMAKVKATLKKFTSFIALEWKYFCEKTSLPGWRYIVLPRLSKVERCVYLLKIKKTDR